MGSRAFFTVGKGTTAKAAFEAARAEAIVAHGRGGYSGTIAEKRYFEMSAMERFTLADARRFADTLIDDDTSSINEKDGPAGCLELETGDFCFFGWASS